MTATTARCPAGHASDEHDYCSVCGVAMGATSGASPRGDASHAGANAGGSANANACPSCGEPRVSSDARFCEVCRFDFVARAPGPPPGAARQVSSSPSSPSSPSTPSPSPAARGSSPGIDPAHMRAWEAVVTIDASLDAEPDASVPPPKDPERLFPIELREMLIGRRDETQQIRPAVPLNDPGASRRHAKLLLDLDGTVALQDLASMNGTKLNGADVVSGSIRPLKEGDEITLGRWTRIKLRARV